MKHDSRRASPIALGGITCFYEHPLKRDWSTRSVVQAQREKKLPVISSPQEVRRILQQGTLLRDRLCLTTIDACGLRLQEGTHLQGAAIDAARRLVHVRHGQGAKDRSVPLPRRTVELVRHVWTTHRHPVWLFPAPGRGRLGMPTAQTPLPQSRVPDALRQARTPCGSNKRAAVHTLRPSSAPPLLEAGITRRLMQAYLGHNPPTTTSVSTHRTVKAKPLAFDALDRLLRALSSVATRGLSWSR